MALSHQVTTALVSADYRIHIKPDKICVCFFLHSIRRSLGPRSRRQSNADLFSPLKTCVCAHILGVAFIVVSSMVPYKFSTYSLTVISPIDFYFVHMRISLRRRFHQTYFGNRMLSLSLYLCRFCRFSASQRYIMLLWYVLGVFSTMHRKSATTSSTARFEWRWDEMCGEVRCLLLLLLSLSLALGRLPWTVNRVERP